MNTQQGRSQTNGRAQRTAKPSIAELPECIDIERQLIGGLCMDPPNAGDVYGSVMPSHFWDPQNRVAYSELRRQYRETGCTDAAMFARAVADKPEFANDALAWHYLVDRAEQLVNFAHVMLYAKHVVDTSKRRDLLLSVHDLANDARKAPLDELASRVAEMASDLYGDAVGPHRPATFFEEWSDRILARERPVDYSSPHSPFSGVRLRPGRVITIAAPPGAGKTVATQQMIFEALQYHKELRAVICQVEMSPQELCDRHLSRISGISAMQLVAGSWPERHRAQLVASMEVVQAVSERITYVPPPFSIGRTRAIAQREGAKIVCIDYIQRTPADASLLLDMRQQVNAAMDGLRRMANENGCCVIAVSAVSRQKDRSGRSSYASEFINLASLKESGELEYGSNDVYFLCESKDDPSNCELLHHKSRGEPKRNIRLRFHREHLRFDHPNHCSDFDDLGDS